MYLWCLTWDHLLVDAMATLVWVHLQHDLLVLSTWHSIQGCLWPRTSLDLLLWTRRDLGTIVAKNMANHDVLLKDDPLLVRAGLGGLQEWLREAPPWGLVCHWGLGVVSCLLIDPGLSRDLDYQQAATLLLWVIPCWGDHKQCYYSAHPASQGGFAQHLPSFPTQEICLDAFGHTPPLLAMHTMALPFQILSVHTPVARS